MKSNLDPGIKCSICNAYCPVLAATGLFPGPKLAGPDAARFHNEGESFPADWLERCDYCKIRERVCPHYVPIPELHIQSPMAEEAGRKPSLRDWLLGHSYGLEKLGSWGTPISNWVIRWAFFRWLSDRWLGVDWRAEFPSFCRKTFQKWVRSRPSPKGIPVSYFHGCFTNYVEPTVGRAVVEVSEKNGFQVFLPRQECCGLPLIGNGYFHLAAKLGDKNLKSLKKSVEEGREIVFSSPSCGMTLTQKYGGILRLEGASILSENTYEIFQFRLHCHEEGRLDLEFRELKETHFYHVPCHLRDLQIGLPALELLSLIPGLRILELPEGCCGLAGTYGFKREKYQVAKEVGEEIFQAVRKAGAKTVISECEACRLQIGHHTGVQTLHPIQLLHRAYFGE